jgi:predicted RNA-binding protein YlxR (DUF448 family)
VKQKKRPERMCVGCREMKPKVELLRIVRSKDEQIMADPTGRKNGRGAYICKSIACLEKARKQKGFDRALDIKIPEEIYDALMQKMEDK